MNDQDHSQCKISACSCLNLRRASNSLTKIYNRFLAPSGLRVSQYSLMKNISRLAPVNVSDLAGGMRLDRTTLVRNLHPLEQKGLVADLSEAGARDRQLVLTDGGQARLCAANILWQDAQEYIENSLGTQQLKELSLLLLKIEQLE